ncbi:MAG: hypothetical protein HOO67_00205 [Candidatus Peribacteraceae bacterium]|nr:hypothetical protein [Candidatus Peribacteraceae bacterium]
MPSYAAFIGHQPHLSLAELAATVPGFLLHEKLDRTAVLFDSAVTLDAAFLDTLGGTVVLAEKLTEGIKSLEDVPDALAKKLLPVKGKATFSLRTLGLAPATIKALYRKSKDHLKKKGKPSRYVGNERKAALSIVLREHKLLDGSGGSELVILQRKGEDGAPSLLWTGMTVGAQDIESYSTRDMEKPVRDTGVGLLPPKLAQIMINFGIWLAKKPSPSPSPTVYDPFCGTGVIPMECLLRGFSALASDKSEKAVTGCGKNLDWLRKEFEIKKSVVSSKVWKHDATKPFEVKETVDVIVTETSLGPSLEKRPTARDAQKLCSENEKLQQEFLRAAAASFPGVPIVCTWPVWYPTKSPVCLERIWKTIDECGYQAVLPPTIEIVGDRVSLLYRRPDQFVGREIVLLRPKRR